MTHSGLVCLLSRTCVSTSYGGCHRLWVYYRTQNETVIKEKSIAGKRFSRISDSMSISHEASRRHWKRSKLGWWTIPYNQLLRVLSEAVAGFAHLYEYSDSKCTLLSQLLGRPVHKLEGFNSPSPRHFRHKFSCTKPCHRNPSFLCATRRANFLYEWLLYQVQKMTIVTWIDDKASYCPLCFSII